jgi:hypothetical protein
MKRVLFAALITITVVQIITLADVSIRHLNYREVFGWYNWIAGWIFFFLGAILCSFKQVRDIGKGILIASGILLIVGYATCTGIGYKYRRAESTSTLSI